MLLHGAHQRYSQLELFKYTLTWSSSNLHSPGSHQTYVLSPGSHQTYSHLDLLKITLTWISSNLLSSGSPQNYSNLELSKLTLTWSSSNLLSPEAHQKKGCAPQCRTGPADPDNMSSLRPFINTS